MMNITEHTVYAVRLDGEVHETTREVAEEAVAEYREAGRDVALLTRTEYTVEPTPWVEVEPSGEVAPDVRAFVL